MSVPIAMLLTDTAQMVYCSTDIKNEYFVMDDAGMDIPPEKITPEMDKVAAEAFEKAIKKYTSVNTTSQ